MGSSKMRGACLRAAVAVLLLVVATDAAESTAGIDMIVPLPTQSDDYVSYIQELVDEFAPGPDPKLHEDNAAFGGVMYHAEQEAKQIDRQSKKDAAQMVKAKAALVAAQKRVADAEAAAMKAKAGVTSAAEETEKVASTKVEKTQKSAEENPPANVVKTEGHTHKVAETAADKKLLGPDSIKVDAKTEQALQAVEHTWKERTDKPKKAIVPSKKTQHALAKTTQPEHVKAKDEKVNAKTEKKLEAIEKQWKEHEAHIEAKQQQKKWDAIAKGTTAKKATAKPKKAAKTKTKKVSKKESLSHRVQKDTALVKVATAEENKLNKEAAAAEKDSSSPKKKLTKKKAAKAGVSDAREKRIVAAEQKAEAKGETYKVPESKHEGHAKKDSKKPHKKARTGKLNLKLNHLGGKPH